MNVAKRGVVRILAAVTLAASAMGCGGSAGDRSADAAQVQSGEDLFRGIFLGTGPVANLLPEIWQNENGEKQAGDVRSTGAYAEGVERIIGRVAAKNPDLFNRFSREIQSGDHLRVERALNHGAQQLLEAAAPPTVLEPQAGACFGFWRGKPGAVPFIGGSVPFIKGGPGSDSALKHDAWVDLITNRFASGLEPT